MGPPGPPLCADRRTALELVGLHYCLRRLSDSLPGPRELCLQVEDLEADSSLEEDLLGQLQAGKLEVKGQAQPSSAADLESHPKPEASQPREETVPRLQVSEEEKPLERWKRRSLDEEGRHNCENLNNNNSKRSCPDDFEVRAGLSLAGSALGGVRGSWGPRVCSPS